MGAHGDVIQRCEDPAEISTIRIGQHESDRTTGLPWREVVLQEWERELCLASIQRTPVGYEDGHYIDAGDFLQDEIYQSVRLSSMRLENRDFQKLSDRLRKLP